MASTMSMKSAVPTDHRPHGSAPPYDVYSVQNLLNSLQDTLDDVVAKSGQPAATHSASSIAPGTAYGSRWEDPRDSRHGPDQSVAPGTRYDSRWENPRDSRQPLKSALSTGSSRRQTRPRPVSFAEGTHFGPPSAPPAPRGFHLPPPPPVQSYNTSTAARGRSSDGRGIYFQRSAEVQISREALEFIGPHTLSIEDCTDGTLTYGLTGDKRTGGEVGSLLTIPINGDLAPPLIMTGKDDDVDYYEELPRGTQVRSTSSPIDMWDSAAPVTAGTGWSRSTAAGARAPVRPRPPPPPPPPPPISYFSQPPFPSDRGVRPRRAPFSPSHTAPTTPGQSQVTSQTGQSTSGLVQPTISILTQDAGEREWHRGSLLLNNPIPTYSPDGGSTVKIHVPEGSSARPLNTIDSNNLMRLIETNGDSEIWERLPPGTRISANGTGLPEHLWQRPEDQNFNVGEAQFTRYGSLHGAARQPGSLSGPVMQSQERAHSRRGSQYAPPYYQPSAPVQTINSDDESQWL